MTTGLGFVSAPVHSRFERGTRADYKLSGELESFSDGRPQPF